MALGGGARIAHYGEARKSCRFGVNAFALCGGVRAMPVDALRQWSRLLCPTDDAGALPGDVRFGDEAQAPDRAVLAARPMASKRPQA